MLCWWPVAITVTCLIALANHMFVWLTCPDLACSDLSLLLHVWLTWLATCLSGWLVLTVFGCVTPVIILLILLGCPDRLLCCQCCWVVLIIPTVSAVRLSWLPAVLSVLLGCPDYLLCCQYCWVVLITCCVVSAVGLSWLPAVLSVLLGCPDYLLCCQCCWVVLITCCVVSAVGLSWLPAVLLMLLGSGYIFRYPEGRPGCLRLSSCLESQGCHLIPLFCLLSRFFA